MCLLLFVEKCEIIILVKSCQFILSCFINRYYMYTPEIRYFELSLLWPRPHLRWSSQPPLASVARESDVQGCCADVQSHTLISTNIPESTGSCRGPIRTSFPPLCTFYSSAGSIHQTVDCRRPGIHCCRTVYLEQSAGQCDFSFYSVYIPPATENLSILSLLPWHYTGRIYLTSSTVVPEVIYITWTTL